MSSIELNAIREAGIWFKIFSIPLVGKLARDVSVMAFQEP